MVVELYFHRTKFISAQAFKFQQRRKACFLLTVNKPASTDKVSFLLKSSVLNILALGLSECSWTHWDKQIHRIFALLHGLCSGADWEKTRRRFGCIILDQELLNYVVVTCVCQSNKSEQKTIELQLFKLLSSATSVYCKIDFRTKLNAKRSKWFGYSILFND